MSSTATDVDGWFVVGTSTRANGDVQGFAHDLRTRETVGLGRLEQDAQLDQVPQVDGNPVVGTTLTGSGATRATLWRLRLVDR